MTLFHLKELWSANCGIDEEFDKASLCICNIDNSVDECDKIITASFKGLLRVFKIGINNSNQNDHNLTQASDLLLEIDLKEPILEISSGILLASTNIQLAVLHPNKFSVYSISSSSGVTEHGTSYNILLIYEHKFDYQAVNMLLGSFGQVKGGKHIICIQDVNSNLNFYENESFSFCFQRNPDSARKFPMQMTYVAHKDLIILVDNLYTFECYQYQELALAHFENSKLQSKEDSKGKVLTEWTYSFGELVLDIQAVLVEKWNIVVLGERNLCVLRENGTLWFIKKFDLNPSCLCSFANESKDSLITIVGTHMHNLLIYQNDVLKWASKIPFVSVSICRSNLPDMSGIMVLLSDDGQLMAGYLGTNPSLKMISMPALSDSVNSDKINQELQELKKIVNAHNLEDNKTINQENKLTNYLELKIAAFDKVQSSNNKFNAVFEIICLTNLKDVKLIFYHNEFYEITPDKFLIDNLEGSFKFESQIEVKLNLPLSTNIRACIVFNHENVYRTITKNVRIPFESLITLRTSPKNHKYLAQVTFAKTFDDKSDLNSLFGDMLVDSNKVTSFSFYFTNYKQEEVTVKQWNNADGIHYLIESNAICGLCLSFNELIRRIKQTNKLAKLKPLSMTINFHPIENLCHNINNRLKHRNALAFYKTELANFSKYYRLIQKRVLVKLKDKNPTSLSNLEKLLKIIQLKINENVERISTGINALNNVNYQVWSHLKMLNSVLKLTSQDETDKLAKFLKIISINQMDDFINQWEERIEWSLFEVFEMNRDIGNMTKMIDYENNCMQNCQNMRTTLLAAFQLFDNKSNSSCSIHINKT